MRKEMRLKKTITVFQFPPICSMCSSSKGIEWVFILRKCKNWEKMTEKGWEDVEKYFKK